MTFMTEANPTDAKSYAVEKDWTSAAGYRCVAVTSSLGHRCGYVGLHKDHPLYGVSYSEYNEALKPLWLEAGKTDGIGKRGVIPLICASERRKESGRELPLFMDVVLDVHGSVTFTDGGDYPVPTAPEQLWWVGFDCAHVDDGKDLALMGEPLRSFYEKEPRYLALGTVRSLEYVVQECENLAAQLAQVDEPAQ